MLLVVVYHFWPEHLSGGFVGVDVFFVISGYLITAHLFKEAAGTGRIRLLRFWARRIRRLLPLSLLVLGLTALAAVLILPSTEWQTTRRQITASALYVQFWVLAADAVAYSKADERATAVQHFWSLSVEEQFYVLWPALLAIVLVLAARASRRRTSSGSAVASRAETRRLFLWVIGLLGAGSLAFSVYYTADSAAQAYFVTPARIWEFALGPHLLALVLGAAQATGRWGNRWDGRFWADPRLGLPLQRDDAVPRMDRADPDSGGGPGHGLRRPAALDRGPLVAVPTAGHSPGDWSYAIYLWHWPVLIFSPYLTDAASTWPVKLLLIGAVIALSALSTRFVETPIRQAKLLLPAGRTMAAAVAGMALVIGVAHYSVEHVEQGFTASEVSVDHPCYGAQALKHPDQCGDPFEGAAGLEPSPAEVAAQRQNLPYRECQADADAEGPQECWLGAEESAADGTIAVVGDSHATMWLPALDEIAQDHAKRLLVMTRSGCHPRGAVFDGEDPCGEANLEIFDRLAGDTAVGTVILGGSQMLGGLPAPSMDVTLPPTDIELNGTARSMLAPIQHLLSADKQVIVLGETPRMNHERNDDETLPECVALNHDDVSVCNDDLQDTRVGPRWLTESERVFEDSAGFHFVPTEDLFCDHDTCYAVLGGAITFNDNSHVSENFVRSATPELAERMAEPLSG